MKAFAIVIRVVSFCPEILMAEPFKAIAGLVTLIVTIFGLMLGFAVIPVKISGDRADDFFRGYFSDAGDPSQRSELYANDFTADYHTHESFSSYEKFWNLAGSATAGEALPAGDPHEFEVALTFH